jgi:hypothetical protein
MTAFDLRSFLDQGPQPRHVLTPGLLVDLRPIVQVLERLRGQAVELALPLPPPRHQPGLPEDPQVLGHGREREIEVVNQLLDGALTGHEKLQDLPPIGIGDGLEDLLPWLEHARIIM